MFAALQVGNLSGLKMGNFANFRHVDGHQYCWFDKRCWKASMLDIECLNFHLF